MVRVGEKKIFQTKGSTKGKYLFAKKRGGAEYRSGPPPDTRRKPESYYQKLMMAPYPGMMKRYDANAGSSVTGGYSGGYSGGKISGEAPQGLPGEPMKKEEVKMEASPEAGPSSEGPPGLGTQKGSFDPRQIDWKNFAKEATLSIVRGFNRGVRGVDNALFGWADRVHPYLGAAIRSRSYGISTDVLLTSLFGQYAEPIIEARRASDEYAKQVEYVITDTLLRPGTELAREGALNVGEAAISAAVGGEGMERIRNTYRTGLAVGRSVGEGVYAAGAYQLGDVASRAVYYNVPNPRVIAGVIPQVLPVPTGTIENFSTQTVGNAVAAGGGTMRNLFLNLLQMAAPISSAERAIRRGAQRIAAIAPGVAVLYNLRRNVPGRNMPGFYQGM